MADVYEQNLTQKSSLTTTDYIRVVGTDNVSYKQRVASVANTMTGTQGTVLTSGTDLNTLTTFGIYYYHSPVSDLTNAPSNAGSYMMLYVIPRAVGTRCMQIMYTTTGFFVRAQRDATSFYDWIEYASASAVEGRELANNTDLNSITAIGKYYTASTSATASITNKPTGLASAFSMDVQKRGDYVNQIIYDYAGAIYIRGKISSGWYNWYKLPDLTNLTGTQSAAFSGDANTLVDTGQYQIGNIDNVTNIPSGVGYGIISVIRARGYIKQIYSDVGKRTEYVRTSTSTGGNWTSWEHYPYDAPIRKAGNVSVGSSFTIELNNNLSQNEGFAIVQLNIGGNAMMGVALLFLGRGTSKIKDLLGTMSTSYYTATYSNSTWTITNNSTSSMLYTAIISR